MFFHGWLPTARHAPLDQQVLPYCSRPAPPSPSHHLCMTATSLRLRPIPNPFLFSTIFCFTYFFTSNVLPSIQMLAAYAQPPSIMQELHKYTIVMRLLEAPIENKYLSHFLMDQQRCIAESLLSFTIGCHLDVYL